MRLLATTLVPSLLLVALVAPSLPAQQRNRADVGAAERVDPAAEEVLQKMSVAQKATHSMSASFRQVKEDALFQQPSVQSGLFSFENPDKFRWDYQKPERVVVVATADAFQRYLPDQKLLRKLDLSKNRRRVFNYFGIGSDVEVLRRHFDMKRMQDAEHPGTTKLELRGKRRRVQKRLALLEMWLDEKTWLPSTIKITMADGGTTLWEFTDVQVNPQLSADTFKLKVAQGTIVQSEEDPSSPLVDSLIDDDDTPAVDAAHAGAHPGNAPTGRP
jgi:outer membrane lipoprotein-sorting protein